MQDKDILASVIRALYVLTFYFGLSFAVLLAVVLRRGFYVDERAYFSNMVEGTAWRPFVYRVLVPKTAYVIGKITPDRAKSAVVGFVQKAAKKRQDTLLGKSSEYRFEYLVVVLWMVLALGFSALIWKSTLREVMQYPEHVCFFLPILGIVGTAPVLLFYGPYVYDTTTLLTFSLATHALLTGSRKLYYPTFVLSLLNKETALLLPLLFAIAFSGMTPRRRLVLEAVLQVLLWGVWRYFLTSIYGENRGSNVEFHLLDYNLSFFTYFSLKQVRFWSIIGAVSLLVFDRWKDKPIQLRRLFLTSCMFLLPLHILFAWIDEFRGLLEMYPIILLLGTPTLLRALGYDLAVYPATRAEM